MITQPASAGLQLLGVFFCFIGIGLLADPFLGGTMQWGWGFLWLPLGIWLIRKGGRGQRERIAKRDEGRNVRVQVLSQPAAVEAGPDDETQPGVIPRETRDRVHAAARAAAQHGRRGRGHVKKG